jgi:hypothetical protein
MARRIFCIAIIILPSGLRKPAQSDIAIRLSWYDIASCQRVSACTAETMSSGRRRSFAAQLGHAPCVNFNLCIAMSLATLTPPAETAVLPSALHTCPTCKGEGKVSFVFKPGIFTCGLCQGSTKVDSAKLAQAVDGKKAKLARLTIGMGLREFASIHGQTVQRISDMEQGVIPVQWSLYT